VRFVFSHPQGKKCKKQVLRLAALAQDDRMGHGADMNSHSQMPGTFPWKLRAKHGAAQEKGGRPAASASRFFCHAIHLHPLLISYEDLARLKSDRPDNAETEPD
jgi:hypothetical protein